MPYEYPPCDPSTFSAMCEECKGRATRLSPTPYASILECAPKTYPVTFQLKFTGTRDTNWAAQYVDLVRKKLREVFHDWAEIPVHHYFRVQLGRRYGSLAQPSITIHLLMDFPKPVGVDKRFHNIILFAEQFSESSEWKSLMQHEDHLGKFRMMWMAMVARLQRYQVDEILPGEVEPIRAYA